MFDHRIEIGRGDDEDATVSGWWLNPTPLKNMSSSVGMMKFPVYGKIKNVPNHQPSMIELCCQKLVLCPQSWQVWFSK